jgi:Na+-driven multidrug efflux pump
MLRLLSIFISSMLVALALARLGVDDWGVSPHTMRLDALSAAAMIAVTIGAKVLFGKSAS